MSDATTTRPAEKQHCRSCKALIYWLRHEATGKTAPVDVAQDASGNLLINLDAGTYRNVPASERETHKDWLHLNHFATCPNAPSWHKYAKGGKP